MIRFIIIEIVLLFCTYCGLYYLKTGSIIPQSEYLMLFGIYILLWTFFSVYYKKYKQSLNSNFRAFFRSLLFSSAFTLFFLTLVVSLTNLIIVSRLFLISLIAVPTLIELTIIYLIRLWPSFNATLTKDKSQTLDDIAKETLKMNWLIGGFVLLVFVFLVMVNLNSKPFGYFQLYENIFLILLGSWAIAIGLTGKYKYFQSLNLYYQITPLIKSGFIMFILIGIVYYFFRVESLPRLPLFGTILVYTTLETVIFAFVFMAKQESVFRSKTDMLNNNYNIFGQEPIPISSETELLIESGINIQSLFYRISLDKSDKIVQFLLCNINHEYEKDSVTLLSTISLENIKVLQSQSQNLLINLHKLNDIRRLNYYMITCHSKIKPGGMLVGAFIPLERIRHKLRSKMPRFIFLCIYPIHFIFFRLFPKLPKIRHFYFILTKAKNRVISKAEVFGRLSFCGYKVITEKLIDDTIIFIAKKVRTIANEKFPSYGPIIHLKRIGLNGKIITIHKFRTMYPYSEFLQEDIYENYGLDSTGDKIKNDFRLTRWGEVLRKYWIDELPQIYDWIRGKVTLVGVRALSEAKYKLYPVDLQQKRIEYLPGLLPPYYTDLPKNFDEFLDSERTYLQRKKEKPFSTNFIYFCKACVNIIFRGARSS